MREDTWPIESRIHKKDRKYSMTFKFVGAALIAMTMTACGGGSGSGGARAEKSVSEITLNTLTSTDSMSEVSVDLIVTDGRFSANDAIQNTGTFNISVSDPFLKDGQMVKSIRYSVDLDSQKFPGYKPFIVGIYYVLDGDESMVVDAINSNNSCDHYNVQLLPESLTRENTSGNAHEFIYCSTPTEDIITKWVGSLSSETGRITFKTRAYQPSTDIVLSDRESTTASLTLDRDGNVIKVSVSYDSGNLFYFNAESMGS